MKRKVKRKKIHRKNLVFFLIFLVVTSILIGINSYKTTNLLSRAEGINTCRCTDPNKCFPDGCSRDNKKAPDVCPENDLGPNMPAENNYLCYVPPDCCTAMVAEDNAYRCCWVERGFCRKEQCAKLSGKWARCGWYWDDHTGEGYGCSRVNVPPIGVPTNPPQPTNPPVIVPTDIPVEPTIPPEITDTPVPVVINPSPTLYIRPTNPPSYIRPTLPPIIITFQPAPTSLPTPTSPPVLNIITKQTSEFWQKLKISLIQFINNILP